MDPEFEVFIKAVLVGVGQRLSGRPDMAVIVDAAFAEAHAAVAAMRQQAANPPELPPA